MIRLGSWAVALVILLPACVTKPGGLGTVESRSHTGVPPAPAGVYITPGQSEEFTYRGYIIKVRYISAYPEHLVKVRVDGNEKLIYVNANASPGAIYWKQNSLSFSLKPVVREFRDGTMVPVYERTWNTSEVYLEVSVPLSASITGGGQ